MHVQRDDENRYENSVDVEYHQCVRAIGNIQIGKKARIVAYAMAERWASNVHDGYCRAEELVYRLGLTEKAVCEAIAVLQESKIIERGACRHYRACSCGQYRLNPRWKEWICPRWKRPAFSGGPHESIELGYDLIPF